MNGRNKAGVWMIFSAGIGAAIGALIHNVALQSGLGAALGLIIWAIFFSGKDRKEENLKKGNNTRHDDLPAQ